MDKAMSFAFESMNPASKTILAFGACVLFASNAAIMGRPVPMKTTSPFFISLDPQTAMSSKVLKSPSFALLAILLFPPSSTGTAFSP
jgi:hypothetical protein